jgi:hypothetical protein
MNDGFDIMSFLRKVIIAFIVPIVGIIGWFVYQSIVQPMMSTSAINITQWNPLVAQYPTVIMPLAIIGAIILIVVLLFFRPPKPANPYMEQMRQQQAAINAVQRKQHRNQPPNPMI